LSEASPSLRRLHLRHPGCIRPLSRKRCLYPCPNGIDLPVHSSGCGSRPSSFEVGKLFNHEFYTRRSQMLSLLITIVRSSISIRRCLFPQEPVFPVHTAGPS
jgi:hypothetical protein